MQKLSKLNSYHVINCVPSGRQVQKGVTTSALRDPFLWSKKSERILDILVFITDPIKTSAHQHFEPSWEKKNTSTGRHGAGARLATSKKVWCHTCPGTDKKRLGFILKFRQELGVLSKLSSVRRTTTFSQNPTILTVSQVFNKYDPSHACHAPPFPALRSFSFLSAAFLKSSLISICCSNATRSLAFSASHFRTCQIEIMIQKLKETTVQ